MPKANQRWYIVFLTVVNQALVLGLIIYSFALFVPHWLSDFGVSRSTVMVALAACSIITGLLSPFAGRIFDRYSIKYLVVAGVALASTSVFLLSQASAFWQVILVYTSLVPLAMVLCGPLPSQIIVSKWFSGKRGLAIGITGMGPNLGGLFIPVVLSLLFLNFDWHGVFLIAGFIYLLLLPLNLLFLNDSAPAPEAPKAATQQDLDQGQWVTKDILRSPAFWIPLIGFVPVSLTYNGIQFHLGALVMDFGHEASLAATLISISAASMISGILLFGTLADKVDHRKIYWLIAGVAITSMMLFLNVPTKTGLMLACCLNGFAMGGVPTTLSMMCSTRFGIQSFGKVLGMVHLFLMFSMLGSIFSGWIFDQYQSYDAAFIVFASLLVPGILLMRFLPETAVLIPAKSGNQ